MIPANALAIALFALLVGDVWIPALVGIGVGLIFAVSFHLAGRSGRTAPAPVAEEKQHDPFEQGSSSEQRGSLRRTGNPVQVLLRSPLARNVKVTGQVIDRSLGGLCVEVRDKYYPDTTLEIRVDSESNVMPWVEIQVVSCRECDRGYQIGCRWLSQPSFPLLLTFG